MKRCWLLYEDADAAANEDFMALMAREGQQRGIEVQAVLVSQLQWDAEGTLLSWPGQPVLPHGVLSRQRGFLLSRRLEALGIPVFNNSKVCELCNDKRKTHAFLRDFPQMPIVGQEEWRSQQWGSNHELSPNGLAQASVSAWGAFPPSTIPFPLVVKPACSHGGDRVALVRNEAERLAAIAAIAPEPFLQQQLASMAGRDLRVYVVFGHITAAVMRTAVDGFLSNFKRGGQVTLHALTTQERALAEEVIWRFASQGAPLCFAGIDFLYHEGHPVIGEVEDVVGSRMLYQASDINIAGLFLDQIASLLSAKNPHKIGCRR